MLTKKNSKNQITLPKEILDSIGEADYFDVSLQNGNIVLEPIRTKPGIEIRARLESLGVGKTDIDKAIEQARSRAALDKLSSLAQEQDMGY